MKQQMMERVALEGIELDYEVRGDGEPVILIHAGVCADWFKAFVNESALNSQYRLVRYHRIGYANSSRAVGVITIEQQAAHCQALMRHLGIQRAHIVGHSSSANMALQLALTAPATVQSLVLMEIALLAVPSGSFAPAAMERYQAGDKVGAVDVWMRGVCGPDYRAVLEKVLPGAFEQAVADADTFFSQELPGLRAWVFGQEEAKHITQPALAVLGARSGEVTPTFDQRHELLLSWLPNAEPFVLPDATHLLHLQNPAGLAERLAAFFARHPLTKAV